MGTFSALGYEMLSNKNPRVFMPAFGVFGFFIVLLVLASGFLSFLLDYTSILVLAGLLVSLGSIIALVVNQITTGPQGTYSVSFSPAVGGQKVLKISYTGPKGRLVQDRVVSSIDTYPKSPLWRKSGRFRVVGTNAYMVISFKKPRTGLRLGFPDAEAMARVYKLLVTT